jgi:hypothetical protein
MSQQHGGERTVGTQTLTQNGASLLLLSECGELTTYRLSGGGVAEAHVRQLDDKAMGAFVATFRLEQWSSLAGEYCASNAFDYPRWIAEHEGRSIVYESCQGNARDSSAKVRWLIDAFENEVFKVGPSDPALTGDVRYLLVGEYTATPKDYLPYRNAPVWPLGSVPAAIAQSVDAIESDGEPERALVATGNEAALLRGIREKVRSGEISSQNYAFTGVVDQAGERYRLFQRDVLKGEDERGVLPALTR